MDTVGKGGDAVVEANRSSVLRTYPAMPAHPTFDTLAVLSRKQIANRVAGGELLIVHAPLVYRVPAAWLALHPGSDLAILHFVGRDATNEIEGYHTGKTITERMARWVVGRVEVDFEGEGWRDMVPPVQLGLWPIPVPTIKISHSDGTEGIAPLSSPSIQGDIRPLTPELVDPPLPSDETLPLTPQYQQHLRLSHRAFQAKIIEMGLDTPPPFLGGYGPSSSIYVGLFVLWVYLYRAAESTAGYFAAAVALGLWWHQLTFVVHDAAHTGLTGDWLTDRLVASGIATAIGGLSASWWAHNHNVHHLVCNSPEHDPDIQHLPFIAISTKFFSSLYSTYHKRIMAYDPAARFFVRYQHKLYYVIMSVARFNLMVLSYTHLITKIPARQSAQFKVHMLEFFGIAIFWTWFGLLLKNIPGAWTRVMFLYVCFAVTSPLHVQIVLSHFSQPVSVASEIIPHTELLESHMHRQLRTTMDISCPTYLDFLHGGLNFQVPHHLIPRIPRFRFRAATEVLREWVAAEQELVKDGTWKGVKLKENEGLVYKKMEFVEANRSVLGVLKNVADQVNVLCKVAEADAKGELHHAH